MLEYLGVTKHNVTHLDPDPGLLIKSGKCAIDEEVWTKPFFIHLQVNIFNIQQPVLLVCLVCSSVYMDRDTQKTTHLLSSEMEGWVIIM